jgi:purine-nucleoside phosphorylase
VEHSPLPYSNASARAAADELRAHFGPIAPKVAIILGSGLGELVDEVSGAHGIPYAEIPGFSEIHIRGHAGELVAGTLSGVPVIVFSGRFHLYEGHTARAVGFPVRLAYAFGARTLLVANAAGGIGRGLAVGDLMMLEDQINMTGTSPLIGPQDEGDVRFPDMSNPFDPELRKHLQQVAAEQNIALKSGVYAGVLGPAYETRAEIRMLRLIGGHAVGMSTVHEVITAKALGMRVAGISCIANIHPEEGSVPLDHADVLAATARSMAAFRKLIRGFVGRLAA